MSRIWPAAIAGLLLTGCAHSGTAPTVALPDGRRASGTALVVAVRSLCDATTQARVDAAKAGSTFYLRSHAGLHTLASALGLADRTRSARLLENMYAVEHDIAAAPQRPALAADLATLTAQAGGGLGVLRLSVPSCITRSQL